MIALLGFIVHIVSYHPGVYGVVELLENITNQKGQCEADNMPQDIPFGHIHVLLAPGQEGRSGMLG